MNSQCVDVVRMSHDQHVDVLKHKIIELYCRYIRRLTKGYKDDYSTILNMINFVSLPYDSNQDDKIFEYLINVRP